MGTTEAIFPARRGLSLPGALVQRCSQDHWVGLSLFSSSVVEARGDEDYSRCRGDNSSGQGSSKLGATPHAPEFHLTWKCLLPTPEVLGKVPSVAVVAGLGAFWR